METIITALQVLALLMLAGSAAIGIIAGICWLGGRSAEQQLDPNSPINYGRRAGDHPSHRCARRQEDEVRERFLLECD